MPCAQAVAVTLDAYDLERHHVPFVDDLAWVLDAAIGELRDVDEAFHRPIQPGEGAEGDELRHLSGHDLPDLVLINDGIPLLGLGPADAQGDLLRLRVHLHHVHVHFLTDLEQLFR